ncbi:hypothetical protein [Bacillus sp. Cr_A10]|nr:hypothetical protein [Bacillus sp. Cr_A10]MDF2066666.1 hypothetical protein [Bacillus sp. Cr_A10]
MVNGELICWHIIHYDTWKRETVERMTEEQCNYHLGEFGMTPYLNRD